MLLLLPPPPSDVGWLGTRALPYPCGGMDTNDVGLGGRALTICPLTWLPCVALASHRQHPGWLCVMPALAAASTLQFTSFDDPVSGGYIDLATMTDHERFYARALAHVLETTPHTIPGRISDLMPNFYLSNHSGTAAAVGTLLSPATI